MPTKDGKRTFVIQQNGGEYGQFKGRTPRQAALKVARRLEPSTSEAEAPRVDVRLRERGTNKVHVYDAWAWEEDAPDNPPEWMGERITSANVSKKRIEHQE